MGILSKYPVIVTVAQIAVLSILVVYYIPVIIEKVTNLSDIPSGLATKISAVFTVDGVKLIFKGVKSTHASSLLENSMGSLQWEKAIAHWCNLVDGAYVACVVGNSDNIKLPLDIMMHRSSFGKEHKGFNTPEGSVYIGSVSGYSDEFILVIPGAFICGKDGEIFIMPMSHTSIKVEKKSFNKVAPNGGYMKTTMYELRISYSNNTASIIYSKPMHDWSKLTV